MPRFLDKLRDRKLVQWALAYVAAAAVFLELLDAVADAWAFPSAVVRTLQALVALGLLATVVVAWYHGETGRQQVAGAELLILAALLATAGLVIGLVRDPESGGPGPREADATPADAVATAVVGVLPVEVHLDSTEVSDWAGLIQRLLSSELARPRGLAVMDDLSLNTLLQRTGAGLDGETYDRLRRAGVHYAVRSAIQRSERGIQVTYHLANTRTGYILLTGSFTNTDERELSTQVRYAANRLIAHLEETSGGITKALDLQPWLTRPPTSVEATRAFLQGTEYAYRGVPGGQAHYERALKIEPDFIAPRIWLVSSLVFAGDTAEAREHVRILRSLEGSATPFEQAMIGWADATSRWDLEEMVRHLEVALGYSPRNNTLLYTLGFSLLELGRAREALPPLRRAVEARWHYPELYPLYGRAAIEAGEVDGLRQTLEDALPLGPHAATIYGLLEALALFEGDEAAAERHGSTFRQLLERREEASTVVPSYRTLAGRARARGDREIAAALLQRAVNAAPDYTLARVELVRVLAEMGDRETAETHYRMALREEPEVPEVVFRLGEVARLLGRSDEARRHFSTYMELEPDGPDARRAQEHLRSLGGSG